MMFSKTVETLAWCGSLLGVGVFAAGASAVAAPPVAARMGLPPAADITAYGIAICGVIVTVANAMLAVSQRYHRFRIETAALEAAKLKAIARIEAAKLRGPRKRTRKPKPKAIPDVSPTPKPDS